ncbi:MAG: aspartate kinase [Candidatus Falkowbacteria bacterium]|nr:aspartate kinase [Candidatus Falkowbacteria bacterium]
MLDQDLIVAKFGGTSLASTEQLQKVKKIIEANPRRKVVVVSAPGKRNPSDTKITDRLARCFDYEKKSRTQPDANYYYQQEFQAVKDHYIALLQSKHLSFNLLKEFEAIDIQFVNGFSRDYAMSLGEYLMAKIMASFLGFEFVDASNLIFFDSRGEIDEARTAHALGLQCSGLNLEPKDAKGIVIPGFYCSMPDGLIKIFSRGGSDISGAIVARFSRARLYENWTDVPGVAVVDPRILPEAKIIRYLSFGELRNMAWGGATVIHPDAAKPARLARIPINVRDTNNPKHEGTLILPDNDSRIAERSPGITGIAVRHGFLEINLVMDGMNEAVGFLRSVLGILAYNNISVEHVPTGVDDASIIVEAKQVGSKQNEIVRKIIEIYPECEVRVETGLSIITVVGKNMKNTPGLLGEMATQLGQSQVNIETVNQGASETTVSFGVKEKSVKAAVRAIYSCV